VVTGSARQNLGPSVLRTTGWIALFCVAVLLGRRTLNAEGVALLGPAVGVAFLWWASGDRRTWAVDGLLAVVATVVLSLATGTSWTFALLGVVLLVPGAAAVAVLRRRLPALWGGGGQEPMSRLSEFGIFVAVVAVSTVLAAFVRTALGVLLVDQEGWDLVVLRTGRSIAALIAVGTFGMLLGARVAQWRRTGGRLVRLTAVEAVESAGVAALTALVFWVGFVLHPEAPTTFILGLGVVWVAIRFSPLAAAFHALLTGVGSMVLTFLGHGPITGVESEDGRAVMVQIFVVVMMVTGMAVSLSRRQFFDTIERLRRSEVTLAQRARQLDLMLENLTDGVAIVEEGGRIVRTNSALREILAGDGAAAIDLRSLRPAPYYHLYHADGRPLSDEEMPYQRVMRGEALEPQEFHLRPPSIPGGRVVLVSAVRLPTEPGTPRRGMVTVRDITAEAAHRDALANFAGTAAHDLNNPLTLVSGWAESLDEAFRAAESVDSTVGIPMVEHILRAAARMREFITDLLAHAVAQDQNLRCERVQLTSLLKELRDLRMGPNPAGEEIVVHDLPAVWADPALLTQLFDNLIGNAFKYVAPGTLPHVTVTASDETPGWVTVRVSDNGIGIPEDQRGKVFESFHRAGRGSGYRGTGLGLAICKRIAERHGGSISVTANPDGEGSCFHLTLPTTPEAFRAGAPA
jgi:signal transduction histidine kinase